MNAKFQLHPQLAADCHVLGCLGGFGGRNYPDSGWVGWENSDLTHSDWELGSGGREDTAITAFVASGGGGGGYSGG